MESLEFEDGQLSVIGYIDIDSVAYSASWDGEQILVSRKDGDGSDSTVKLNGCTRIKRYSQKFHRNGLPAIFITEELSAALNGCMEWDFTLEDYAKTLDEIDMIHRAEIRTLESYHRDEVARLTADLLTIKK